MKSTGSWYNVFYDGKKYDCRAKGKLRLEGFKTTNPIAVGDRVEIIPEPGSEDQCLIEKILPRENFVIRKATKTSKESHVIAANLNQAVLMVTIANPRTSLGFIDRFTVSTESFRIPTIIVFNKKDILDESQKEKQREYVEMYSKAGFKCLEISVKENEGLKAFVELLKKRVTLIAGHSGVGKSTFLNKINPDINQKVADISDFSKKGVHTTTFAEMFLLGDESFVIDTPGIKEFGLIDIEDYELSDYFPEMRALRGACKFNNCTHTHEPKCAILDAVKEGKIAESRYQSYLSMLHEEDTRR